MFSCNEFFIWPMLCSVIPVSLILSHRRTAPQPNGLVSCTRCIGRFFVFMLFYGTVLNVGFSFFLSLNVQGSYKWHGCALTRHSIALFAIIIEKTFGYFSCILLRPFILEENFSPSSLMINISFLPMGMKSYGEKRMCIKNCRTGD